MISSKSDYKYVTGLDDILIDGQILPLRNDAADKTPLRGEDIAFLIEAATEIEFSSQWRTHEFDKIVNHLHPWDAWQRLHQCFEFKSYYPTGDYHEKILANSENTPHKAFPGLFNLNESIGIDEARTAFSRGAKVEREPIAKMFEDVAKFKYFCYNPGSHHFENDSTVITGIPPTIPVVLDRGALYDEEYSYNKNSGEYAVQHDYVAKNPTEIMIHTSTLRYFDKIDGLHSAWVRLSMRYSLGVSPGNIYEGHEVLLKVPARIESNKLIANVSSLTDRIPQIFDSYFEHTMIRPRPADASVWEWRDALVFDLWPIFTIGSRTRW